ncbi:hypothetical protein K3217_05350 [bacterium BD-1]|nr:hypothetical protein [Ottowia caeni]
MAAKKTTVKTPAAKAGVAQGRASRAQVGLSLNPFVGFELSPLEWLEKAPERLQLLSELAANLTPQQVHRIQDASTWCKLASKAALSEEPKVAAAAAARAMMAVYLTWRLVDELGLLPKAARDSARQSGTTKPRGPRRPKLDAWLSAQLLADPDASDKSLWRKLPLSSDELWLDGERVCEGAPGDKGLTFEGFSKRATAARKRQK